MIPGANLLRTALRLIAPKKVKYLKFLSRTQNAARQWVPTFATAEDVWVSVQAVPRAAYTSLGLDFQKNYVRIYAEKNVVDLARDSSGDRFSFDDLVYQLEDQRTWFIQDGWSSVLAVELGPISAYPFEG